MGKCGPENIMDMDACFILSIVGVVLCCVSQQLSFIELEGCSQ